MKDSREPSVPPRIGWVDRLDSCPPDGFARVIDDRWIPIEHLFHVPVRLFDRDLDADAGIAGGDLSRQRFERPFLLAKPRGHEISNQQADRRVCTLAVMT